MSQYSHPRISRYSKAPSLSTINSDEEFDFHAAGHHVGLGLSPYRGGGSDRNSVVSPISQPDTSPVPNFGVALGSVPHSSYNTSSIREDSNIQQARLTERAIHLPSDNRQYQGTGPETSHPLTRFGASLPIANFDTKAASANTTRSVSPSMDSEKSDYENGEYKQTQWIDMLLELDEIPSWHNVVVSLCTWLILAAYLVLPGTFTKLKSSELASASAGQPQSQLDNITHGISKGVDNLGLAVVSAIFASAGAFICVVFWVCHWKNYLWLNMKIFMPVMLNSYAGLLTTLINVYTAQKGVWSFPAKVNAIVSGSVAGLASLIYCIYSFGLLKNVKLEHEKQFPRGSKAADPNNFSRAGRRLAMARRMFARRRKS